MEILLKTLGEKIWLVWLSFLVTVCSDAFHEKQYAAANILTAAEFYCAPLARQGNYTLMSVFHSME